MIMRLNDHLNDQTPQCQKVVKDNMWPAYQ